MWCGCGVVWCEPCVSALCNMHMSMYMWRTCMHMDMYVRVYMSLYMPYTCTTCGHVHAMYMCV